jgi:uracil-DNA glycosylase
MLDEGWTHFFQNEIKQDYFGSIAISITGRRSQGAEVYPDQGNVFMAFMMTPFESVKAVIVGEEPYHQPHQATGLAYSVPTGAAITPQLTNIYKELNRTCKVPIPKTGNISDWAKGGVLLLNSVLTVEKNKPGSHRDIGWREFTNSAVKYISDNKEGVVFCLWGNSAHEKTIYINKKRKHKVLHTTDPSPGSAEHGFNGCGHFNKINDVTNLW